MGPVSHLVAHWRQHCSKSCPVYHQPYSFFFWLILRMGLLRSHHQDTMHHILKHSELHFIQLQTRVFWNQHEMTFKRMFSKQAYRIITISWSFLFLWCHINTEKLKNTTVQKFENYSKKKYSIRLYIKQDNCFQIDKKRKCFFSSKLA